MDMREIFGKALGIDKPWFISDVNFDVKAKRLDIKIDFPKGTTFPFEHEGVVNEYKAYDTVEKEWRHLNFFEHECYLHARVPRIKTPDNKIHLIMPYWSGLQNGFTLLFEALILQLSKGMPVHQVCQLVHISDHKVWSILDKYVKKTRDLNNSRDNPLLKGTHYLFLKNDNNLSQAQRTTKAELQLSKLNAKLFRALSLREAFQQLYAAPTENDFEMLLKRWYFWATHSRLKPMKKAAKTIKNHWDGILQWKKSQINNGILEGLNSVV